MTQCKMDTMLSTEILIQRVKVPTVLSDHFTVPYYYSPLPTHFLHTEESGYYSYRLNCLKKVVNSSLPLGKTRKCCLHSYRSVT